MTPTCKSFTVPGKDLLPPALQDTACAKRNVKWSDTDERVKFCRELISQAPLSHPDKIDFYTSNVVWSSEKSQQLFKENLLAPSFNLEQLKTLDAEPDQELILKQFEKIRAKAEPGVSFKKTYLSYDKITNGLCSAISLNWIFSHLQAKKASEHHTDPSPKKAALDKTVEGVAACVSAILPLHAVYSYVNYCVNSFVGTQAPSSPRKPLPRSLESRVYQVAQKYLFGAPKEIAASQNAFNAIAIDSNKEEEIDLKRAKVQSLANLYSMRVTSHTESEIPSKETFKTVQKLEDGIYLIRSLLLSDNHKGEVYGHSQALLKEKGELIFQDPCFGTVRLPKDTSGEEIFTECLTMFNLMETRFYKMELDS